MPLLSLTITPIAKSLWTLSLFSKILVFSAVPALWTILFLTLYPLIQGLCSLLLFLLILSLFCGYKLLICPLNERSRVRNSPRCHPGTSIPHTFYTNPSDPSYSHTLPRFSPMSSRPLCSLACTTLIHHLYTLKHAPILSALSSSIHSVPSRFPSSLSSKFKQSSSSANSLSFSHLLPPTPSPFFFTHPKYKPYLYYCSLTLYLSTFTIYLS